MRFHSISYNFDRTDMCQGKIHILDIMSDVLKRRIPYSSTTALMFTEEHISIFQQFEKFDYVWWTNRRLKKYL